MRVLKFGGTSLANVERMQSAVRIVARHQMQEPVAVVVSAMASITNDLVAVAQHAHDAHAIDSTRLDAVARRHQEAYLASIGQVPASFEQQWAQLLDDAGDLIHAYPEAEAWRAGEAFSGWGERLMTPLFATLLRRNGVDAEPYLDAPVILESNSNADPSPIASLLATRAWLLPQLAMQILQGSVPVLPGYVARDAGGRFATLGRNGSDYSAAMIAAAMGANALFVYSDVAGIYSADPHQHPDAILYPELTYGQAMSIVAHGARVLHPRTIGPLAKAGIPIWLRSTFEPDRPGTIIGADSLTIKELLARSTPDREATSSPV